MSRLGELLGSFTRGNIVEALALSERPLTAYRIAKAYNMNVAKVYSEVKRLEGLRMVKRREMSARGREYELANDNLRNLALTLSPRVQTYESWRSADSRRARFRMGLASVPPVVFEEPPPRAGSNERRMPGELENIAKLGRRKFDSKYRRRAGRDFDRL